MNAKEILKFCLQNGLLLDEKVLRLFSETADLESAKLVIQKIKNQTKQIIITKEVFDRHKDGVFLDISEEKKRKLQKLRVKLGLSIEISKEISTEIKKPVEEQGTKEAVEEPGTKEISKLAQKKISNVKIISKTFIQGKKYEMKDFLKHFRNRFLKIKEMLQDRHELKNLISIDKISGSRSGISIIGMVLDKRVTKNRNILFEVEDLTGKVRVLVNQNKKELYEKAEDIPLDSVVGFTCSGNREILFANEIVFPDARILQRKRSSEEEYALFISDIQMGSKFFMEKNFEKFIDYLNGKIPNTPEVEKIKYLFIVGDIVEGIGVFPRQENELVLRDLEEQFARIAGLLGKIRRNITIIISPGNHDGVRLMEPQPIFDEKYAWPLFNLKNVVLTGNPAYVNFGAKKDFSGFNILMYHGFSYPYYADKVPRFMDAGNTMNTPTKIMSYLLKHRHLAPAHASTQYAPLEEDGLMIKTVPDIFISGHTHKLEIKYSNNVLLISTATWESQNKFQERMGNEPDFCKVPMFNLKTGEIKILDFEGLSEEKEQEKLLEVK